MKKIKIFYTLIVLLNVLQLLTAQTIPVDGYSYLENQTIHNDIQILFKRVAPSIIYDTAFSDNSGYFNHEITQGIYNIYYSKEGYLSDSLISKPLYSATTLPDITLEEVGLNGLLSGTLNQGIYKVGGNIEVATGDTLYIEPGVKLMFVDNTDFIVNGLLIASGNLTDSIYFTSYSDSAWNGIRINENANDATTISFAVIEKSNDKGIELYNTNPTLVNLTIRNNDAYPSNNQYYGLGGGIYIFHSNPILKEIVFDNNYAFFGSAIHSKQGSFSVENCIIKNHHSFTGASVVVEEDSFVEIINSIIFNSTKWNVTLASPTAIRSFDSKVIVRNSIIHNNQFGGIIGFNSNIKIINSLIHNNNGYDKSNKTYWGSGIVIENGEANLINSIFTNHAYYGIINSNNPPITINNCCFWNNDESFMSSPVNYIGTIVTVNLNGDSCDAYKNIFIDPQFTDTTNYDFTLIEESPCIEAGLNDSIYFNTDVLGNIRIFDGNNDNDTIVDIGPYEFGAPLFTNSTDFQKLNQEFSCKIYPNPSTGLLNIRLDEQVENFVEIYNSTGTLIYKDCSIENRNIMNINLLNQPKGLYILKLINKEIIHSHLIIIQ